MIYFLSCLFGFGTGISLARFCDRGEAFDLLAAIIMLSNILCLLLVPAWA